MEIANMTAFMGFIFARNMPPGVSSLLSIQMDNNCSADTNQ